MALAAVLVVAALALKGAAGHTGSYTLKEAALDPLCPPHPPTLPLTEDDLGRIAPIFDQITALMDSMVTPTVPSAVLGVFYRGEPIFTHGAGKLSTTPGAPAPTVDTKYRIGSVSKLFPTLQLLMMAAEGYMLPKTGRTVTLDATLDELLGVRFVNPFGDDQPTLRQLASQSSGLPREAPCNGGLLRCNVSDAVMLERLAETILIHRPGEGRPSYSNLAYSLLGRALMLGSSVTWEEWVQHHILDPLGMTNTGFGLDAAAVASGAAATGYDPTGAAVPQYSVGWMQPCGGMSSTVTDLAKFGAAILNSTLLPEAYTTEFLKPGYINPDGTTAVGMPWESTFNSSTGFFTVAKGGNIPGYAAGLALIPDLELTVVALWPAMAIDEQAALNFVTSAVAPALVDAMLRRQSWLPAVVPNAKVNGNFYSKVYGWINISTQTGGSFAPMANATLVAVPFILGRDDAQVLLRQTTLNGNTFQLYVPPYLVPCLANELVAFNLEYLVFEEGGFDVITAPGITGAYFDPQAGRDGANATDPYAFYRVPAPSPAR